MGTLVGPTPMLFLSKEVLILSWECFFFVGHPTTQSDGATNSSLVVAGNGRDYPKAFLEGELFGNNSPPVGNVRGNISLLGKSF